MSLQIRLNELTFKGKKHLLQARLNQLQGLLTVFTTHQTLDRFIECAHARGMRGALLEGGMQRLFGKATLGDVLQLCDECVWFAIGPAHQCA